MRSYHTRLQRLEEQCRRRVPVGHFLSVVRYDWQPGEPDDAWRRGVVCPCGERGCPELRVGLLLPEKIASPEDWAARVATADRSGGVAR